MGGIGSGGSRSGTGSKLSEERVLGLIGPKKTQDVPSPVDVPLPAGTPDDVAAIWAELAPHALESRTLVPSTATAFLRLCKAIVRHAVMEVQIEKDGLTYLKVSVDGAGVEHSEVKAHPLISRAGSLESSIKAWM